MLAAVAVWLLFSGGGKIKIFLCGFLFGVFCFFFPAKTGRVVTMELPMDWRADNPMPSEKGMKSMVTMFAHHI